MSGVPEFPDRYKPAAHYDNVFQRVVRYNTTPERSGYLNLWTKVLKHITRSERCADFGCATGQFAQLLITKKRTFVLGVDISTEGIQRAMKRNKRHAGCFHVGDVHDPHVFQLVRYDTAIFLETLEHVLDDLAALANVPSGCKVILTVPNFKFSSHVRYFPTMKSARRRYKPMLKLTAKDSCPVGKNKVAWLLVGVKR